MQRNEKSFRWRRRVHNKMTRHPIHLKRKEEETKNMRKQYTRELKYDHQKKKKKKKHQSVSHFEKYMYLLLFSLNYIVIPNSPSSLVPYFYLFRVMENIASIF